MLCWPYNHVNQPWADTRCLPLEPTPQSRLGCGRVPDWAPCVTPQLPLSYVSPVVTPVSQVTPSYVAPRSLPVAVWQVCSVRPCLCPSPMDGFISTVLLGPTCAVLGLLARSCPALCDPVDCSPPDTSIHGASLGKNARFYIYIYTLKWSEVAQLCPALYDPVDCSPPGSSVRGIFQASVLEWGAISFSRGSSPPRDRTRVSHTVGRHFTIWSTREVLSVH